MQSNAKPLTKELLLSRSKTEKLSQIKNVNLFGNDYDDLSVFSELTNVEIVSLSINKISTLRYFQNCFKLAELYLRKNLIQDLSEVQYLTKLTNLRVLWLSNNPCAEQANYRLHVIKMLPSLIKLDNAEITSDERNQARQLEPYQQQLQRKPSQISVLQQNTNIQNHQGAQLMQQVPSASSATSQNSQSKSPFKSDGRKIQAADQQLKHNYSSQQPPPQSHSPLVQHNSQLAQQQPQVIKKVRPGSALGNNQQQSSSQQSLGSQGNSEQRNENLLCAVLALLKELGEQELELVKRDIDKKLVGRRQQ